MNFSARAIRDVLASTSDALLLVGGDGRILYANPRIEQLFGYPAAELLGQPIEILIPEGARERHEKYRRHFRGEPHARPLVSGLNLQGRRRNGEVFDAEISLTPIRDGDDLVIASTVRDIGAAGHSEAYFRQLLEAAPDAIIVVDANGRIATVNGQALRMFGYARDEMLGLPIESLLPADLHGRHREHRATFMQSPKLRPMGTGMDLRARRADGSEFPVEISLSPIESAGARFVSSVIRDVTDRKQMESELIEARRVAERAHKANTAFLAAASHDLRQPVQALSLLTGALRRTVTDELAREMVDSQQQSLDAMTNLLNSLLDISRLDAGAIEPEFEDFPVRRLVDRLSAEFTRQARQKGLRFVATADDTIIRSDPNLLAEIIQNLVSNAIRYTEQGEVSLGLRQQGADLAIDVNDTGIGIPGDQLGEIFREFHQLKTGNAATAEGFGLGLAIVRRLADLLEHEIVVESEPGRGSRFSVIVPVVASGRGNGEKARTGRTVTAATAEGVILLIEDDARVIAAWSMLLKAEGYRVLSATTAQAAAEIAAGLERAPDLIISDYHLAEGSTGVEAVDAVRSRFSSDLPAFIVSGDTSKVVDDARRLKNCLLKAKPIHADELLELAREAVRSGNAPTT